MWIRIWASISIEGHSWLSLGCATDWCTFPNFPLALIWFLTTLCLAARVSWGVTETVLYKDPEWAILMRSFKGWEELMIDQNYSNLFTTWLGLPRNGCVKSPKGISPWRDSPMHSATTGAMCHLIRMAHSCPHFPHASKFTAIATITSVDCSARK